MKEYGKKISRYLMKNKKGRFYCVASVLYLLAILFVMNVSDTDLESDKSGDNCRREKQKYTWNRRNEI